MILVATLAIWALAERARAKKLSRALSQYSRKAPREVNALVEFVRNRQAVGLEKYGHGVRRDDDTRSFGTTTDSWYEMAQEEIGDAIHYVVCAALRARGTPRLIGDVDDNHAVVKAIKERSDPEVCALVELWLRYEQKRKNEKGEYKRFSSS